jgi:hypothetical protein
MLASAFAKKYEVKLRVQFYDTVSGDWPHTAYKVRLKQKKATPGVSLKLKYRMGIDLTSEPTRNDVLHSVALDIRCGMMSFYEYCDDFGSDPEQIETVKTWKACRKFYNRAYEWCESQQMFDDLISIDDES